MTEGPTNFVGSSGGARPDNVAETIGKLALSMTRDFQVALGFATNAQVFLAASDREDVTTSVTPTIALVGAMFADSRIRERGRESGLDWDVFKRVVDLERWDLPGERPSPDASFDDDATEAIFMYANKFGRNRPSIDSLGLAWALVLLSGDVEGDLLNGRLVDAGSDPEQLQNLLWEAIASELQDVPESDGDELERRKADADRRSGDPDRRAPEDTVPEDGRYDRTRTLTDAPAVVDLLNREPLAESLAIRFRDIRVDAPATSFLLHVDGPWGSGKSTLLNFLEDQLESDSLVVHFNAWREQRAGPPWWGLLVALRRAAIEDAGWRFRLRELAARLLGLGARFWIVAVLAVTLTVTFFVWATDGRLDLATVGERAALIAPIVALAGAVWAATRRLSASRAPGSKSAATKYVENQDDPMEAVASQFNEVVRLVRKPVVIFVDDLDRCTGKYVVELLEAVQTVVRDEPRVLTKEEAKERPSRVQRLVLRKRGGKIRHAPYFVVAADGRWIRASYEKEYSDFAQAVSYPGRPLGYLFLDKAFQLTTTLPAIDLEMRNSYWAILLGIGRPKDVKAELDAASLRARETLAGARTDEEVLDLVESQGWGDPILQVALRGEAVRSMASATVSSTEHALRPFADLLDPNPRAMKRFVNAYSVERALRTIEDRRPRLDQLARWTIVVLRWPQLADILRNSPDLVVHIGQNPGIPSDEDSITVANVADLLKHPDVVRTITDDDPKYGRPLDADGIRESAGL